MKNPIKYPRTPHLPWSPGATPDDIHSKSLNLFDGRKIVVTEKMDGENTTLYCDGMHARSIDGRAHPSRDWVKSWHAGIAHTLPEDWRFCGENVFAEHSIAYASLDHYFYLFSIWNEQNQCLSWPETVEWAQLINCAIPRVLYHGQWDESAVRAIYVDPQSEEGYVVRLSEGFHYDDFKSSIAKWVRPNHVRTDHHWMHQAITPNTLKNEC